MEVEKEHDRTSTRTLSEKDLERMGFNFPKDVLRVINEIEVGRNEIDIVKLDKAITQFVIGFDKEAVKGQEATSICISNHYEDPDHLLACIPYWWKFDHLLFIDRRWIPIADRNLQNTVIEAIRDGGSVEEELKCLDDYTYKQRSGGSDDPGETDSPNAKKEAPESKEETVPQSNSDDRDLRNAVKFCEAIFEEKLKLYGASFCYMNPETVTDQLYMKATVLKNRVTERNKGRRFELAFFEYMRDEFAAVVNYSIIALRQGRFGVQTLEVPESPMRFYSDQMQAALELITEKGAEYGELWREQRIGTFADMIDVKIRRLKGIENQYRVERLTKEDYHKFAVDQYRDMINYGLFGIVRLTAIIEYEKQMEGIARFV